MHMVLGSSYSLSARASGVFEYGVWLVCEEGHTQASYSYMYAGPGMHVYLEAHCLNMKGLLIVTKYDHVD